MRNEISAGIPLKNEDDKAFYEKYRHKYRSMPREQDDDSFAYWESERTDAEALRNSKGAKVMIKSRKVYIDLCPH
jgi:hypothetical protein